eukprot:TRINITY_DN30132_c1_g1_i1.p1 TRINITY_DN30132_c1_g1~~TRINITY_DN30132_c1_g1_i1.p1  ORF type:complete len:281 (-),score=35.60 TRINITY_DN30132_c1_g1_i1:48-890(-)
MKRGAESLSDVDNMDVDKAPPPAWMEAFRSMMNESLDSRINPMIQSVTQLQRESADTRKAVAVLEQRMTALERADDRASVCSTSASLPAREDSWTATKVELRGFCKYEERNERGLSPSDTQALVNELRSSLPVEMREHVKEPEMHSAKATNILIPVTAQFIPVIVKLWKDHIAVKYASDDKLTGLFARAEPHPTRKAANRLMGRLLRFVEFQVKGKNFVTEGFFAPDFAVYTGPKNSKAELIATFDETSQKDIRWSPAAPRIFGLATEEDVVYAFRKHRG